MSTATHSMLHRHDALQAGSKNNIGASYDGSTATYRLLRAFNWGPILMNLGFYPFRGPLRFCNWFCEVSLAQRRLAGKSLGLLACENGQGILDVACGRGTTSFMLAQMYPQSRVVGVDYLAENTAAAQTLFTGAPRLEYHRGDAMNLEFPDASFERVHCLEAAFHFPDKFRFLCECARVLKPGGRLALVDLVWRSKEHRRRSDPHSTQVLKQIWQYDDLYSREEYLNGARDAGFEIVAEHDWTRQVTDPLVSLMGHALWLARRPWGRRLIEGFNPQARLIDDDAWRELEASHRAYVSQQPFAMYFAMVAVKK